LVVRGCAAARARAAIAGVSTHTWFLLSTLAIMPPYLSLGQFVYTGWQVVCIRPCLAGGECEGGAALAGVSWQGLPACQRIPSLHPSFNINYHFNYNIVP
jgi:hypothetical protein